MRIEKQITIGQAPRTLVFSVLSFSYMEKALGKSITDIQKDFEVIQENKSINQMFDLCGAILYGALMAAKSKNTLPVNFSFDLCLEWIDEVGIEIFTEETLTSFVKSISIRTIEKSEVSESGEAIP